MWRRAAFLILLMVLGAAGPLSASEGASAGNPVLGISLRLVNMVLFFGLLVYLMARPIRGFFEKHTEEIREKLEGSLRKEEEGKRLLREAGELQAGMGAEMDKLRHKFEEERARLREEMSASTRAAVLRLREEHRSALAVLDTEAQKALAAHAFQAARRQSLAHLKSHVTAADRARYLADLVGEP